jgi:hypothetical protein
MYSLERFEARLRRGWPSGAIPVYAVHGRGRWGAASRPGRALSCREVRPAFARGATVCISELDRVDRDVAALCEEVRAALGYPGDVHANAYWSPHGSGFDRHFDVRVATTLQLSGAKTWRFTSDPAVAWPIANGYVSGRRVRYFDEARDHAPWEYRLGCDPRAWEETALRPGDLLCLPAGALHAARAEGHSFALNLHFNRLHVGRWIGSLLDRELGDEASWRHVPPLAAAGVGRRSPNERGRAFLVERLDEAIATLARWRRDPAQMGGPRAPASGGTRPPARRSAARRSAPSR